MVRVVFLVALCPIYCYASFFALDTKHPPYLQRQRDSLALSTVQWDTGTLARAMAMSQMVMVNHHGLYTFGSSMHQCISGLHRQQAFECDEYDNALCATADLSTVVFASAGDIVVSAKRSSLTVPDAVSKVRRAGCSRHGSSHGRVVRDDDRYDLSACDVQQMEHSFVLHGAVMYVVPVLLPPAAHFVVCLGAMVILSGVLFFLVPKQVDLADVEGYSAVVFMDVCVTCATLVAVAVAVTQAARQTFVVWEDAIGFVALTTTFVFYLVRVLSTFAFPVGMSRDGGSDVSRQYDAGLTIDCLVSSLAQLCAGVYSTLQHPFHWAVLVLLLFRLCNKLLRFNFGSAYIAAHALPWTADGAQKGLRHGAVAACIVFVRFVLDSVNIAFALAYGWSPSFQRPAVSGIYLIPLTAGAYLAARYVFILGGKLR